MTVGVRHILAAGAMRLAADAVSAASPAATRSDPGRTASAQRLDGMAATGVVERRVPSTRPVAVAYSITDFGVTALDFPAQLKDWAEAHDT